MAHLVATCQQADLGEQSLMVDIVVSYAQDLSVTNPLDSYVMDVVETMQSFDLRIRALTDLEHGNTHDASQKLRQASAILTSQGNITLSERVRAEVDYNLRQYGQISLEGRKMILLSGRRMG